MSSCRITVSGQRRYHKSSIRPPGGGGLFISSPFEAEGGLIETGGLFERRGLFNLKTTMASVLHKELEYKVQKLKYKTF